MRTQLAFAAGVLLLVSELGACATPTAQTPLTPSPTLAPPLVTPTPIPSGSRVVKAQITSAALAGNLIGDPATRDYYVYLPPGYDSGDMRYPVVFVLHGYPLAGC